MTVWAGIAGAADAAELHDSVATAGIVRVFTPRVRSACRDGTLHAHREHDGSDAPWSIPLVCALAWRAGHGAARQRAMCPLCMLLSRARPVVVPRPRAR